MAPLTNTQASERQMMPQDTHATLNPAQAHIGQIGVLASLSNDGPVKIFGHKSLQARKKGLALTAYPESFLQGNR